MMKTSFDMSYLDFCQKPTKIYKSWRLQSEERDITLKTLIYHAR